MRPITATATPASTTAMVYLDPWEGSHVGVQVVPSGGAQFTVDYSFDDPNDLISPVAQGSMFFDTSMVPAGAVGGSAGLTFAMPVAPTWGRLRLLNGVGSVRATFLQTWLDTSSVGASGVSYPPLPVGALGVWSLRKTRANYAGNAIRVAAAGTVTPTLDVGFTANGVVNYAAAFAFCAPAPATVLTLYDQSTGGANNLTSAGSGNAPQLVLINGTPWLAFTNYQGNSPSPAILAGAASIPLAGDMTLGMVMQLGTDGSQTSNITSLFGCADGTNGYWWFANNTPGSMSVVVTATQYNAPAANLLATSVNAIALTRAGSALAFYQNGANVGSVAGSVNLTNASPFTLGGFTPSNLGFYFEGLFGEGYAYGSALTPTQISALAASQAAAFPKTGWETYWNGAASVQFGYGEAIVMGNVLAFDRGQVWTLLGEVQLYSSMGYPGDCAILSNIPHAAPYPGWGVMVTSQGGRYGVLHLLLVNTLGSNAIELFGSTNICDGKKHMIAVTYNGSSAAGGFVAYIDGVLETLSVTQNNLSATIIGTGQSLQAGAQISDPLNYLRGTLGFVQLDFAVRSQGYIQGCTTLAATPNDATTQIRLNLTEAAGTLAHDTGAAGNALNGTLTSAGMWRP
jgi:hypothetical protein